MSKFRLLGQSQLSEFPIGNSVVVSREGYDKFLTELPYAQRQFAVSVHRRWTALRDVAIATDGSVVRFLGRRELDEWGEEVLFEPDIDVPLTGVVDVNKISAEEAAEISHDLGVVVGCPDWGILHRLMEESGMGLLLYSSFGSGCSTLVLAAWAAKDGFLVGEWSQGCDLAPSEGGASSARILGRISPGEAKSLDVRVERTKYRAYALGRMPQPLLRTLGDMEVAKRARAEMRGWDGYPPPVGATFVP